MKKHTSDPQENPKQESPKRRIAKGTILAAGLAGAMAFLPGQHKKSPEKDTQSQNAKPEKPSLDPETAGIDSKTLQSDLDRHVDGLKGQIATITTQLNENGVISPELVNRGKAAAESLDPAKIGAVVDEARQHAEEKGPEGRNNFVLFLSLLGLVYFVNMMYRAAKDNAPISFVRHHLPFLAALLGMMTQMPEEIMSGMRDSMIAFMAVMGVTRLARGVKNNVNFEKVSEEEAKSIIFVFGWLGSVFNSLTTATVLSPLASKLNDDDRYIAMQNIGNIDGGVGAGAFPGIVPATKLGLVAGPLYQAGVMLPIMIFQKIYQGLLWRPKLLKHAPLLWEVLKGFRYKPSHLGKAATAEEEKKSVEHAIEELQEKLKGLRGELGDDYKSVLDALDQVRDGVQQSEAAPVTAEPAMTEAPAAETAEKKEEHPKVKEYEVTAKMSRALEEYLKSPEMKGELGEVAEVVTRAMRDGHITIAELKELKDIGELHTLIKKIPEAARKKIANFEGKINRWYDRLCKALHATPNEREIGRVFTVQALAVPVLLPIVETFLKKAPWATGPVVGGTTAFADNWAATSLGWSVDSAVSIAVAICLGGSTIYGNMPNLNFLGHKANLGESIRKAIYLVPTGIFLILYLASKGYTVPVQMADQVRAWVQSVIG